MGESWEPKFKIWILRMSLLTRNHLEVGRMVEKRLLFGVEWVRLEWEALDVIDLFESSFQVECNGNCEGWQTGKL